MPKPLKKQKEIVIQCCYCKANSGSFGNGQADYFHRREKMRETKEVIYFSSYGCDNCKNYADAITQKL